MACSNCNTQNCGCSGTYVVSQTCPPACSEVFNTACVVYTGVDLTCTNSQTGLVSTVVNRNDYLDDALTKIVRFICDRANEALTSTIVTTASQPYLSVTPSLVGSVTTFSVDLDIAAVAAAVDGSTTVVEAGGTNVTVDETVVGTVTTYTVTAQGTDVVSGDDFIDVQITQNGDDDIATITLDINEVEAALGTVSVAQGTSDHVVVTTVNNFPTTGDTQYRLDTISTDVVSTDPILTVVQSGGIAPDYDQVFTLDLDDALLGDFIMDTAGANIVGTGGITVAYDAIAHQITIGETIGIPDQWKIISDSVLDITAGSPTDKLSIVSGIGTAVALVAGVNEGTFTVTNTDLGSDQLIFGSVDCNNGGPSVGTCTASTNTDALTIVGGDDITLGVAGNTITINNDIDNVYSDVIADSGGSLQAATTTATLELLGGTGISTVGAAGPTNSVTINNDGVLSVASADANLTVATVAGACTITNAAPDQVVAITGGTNINVTGTYPSFTVDAAAGTATAVMAESIVKDATMVSTGSGGTISVAGLTGKTYVQVRVIALATSGAFVAGQDATSDFKIGLTAASVSLTSTSYIGDIKVIIVG